MAVSQQRKKEKFHMPDSGYPDDGPADTVAANHSPAAIPPAYLPLMCSHVCGIHLPDSDIYIECTVINVCDIYLN